MTEEAQQIAIAEACGTLKEGKPQYEHRYGPGPMKVISRGPPISPNYLSDLNAMHEAEKVLARNQKVHYLIALAELTKVGDDNLMQDFHEHCATAAQRAEAFLRILSLWDDNK